MNKNPIIGEHYRITVITDRMIRMEYSPSGTFEDRPSQKFIHRHHRFNDFSLVKKGSHVEIDTGVLKLRYREGSAFSRESLSITMVSMSISSTGVWRFGQKERGNYKGTAKTLDQAEGAISLEDGLMSDEGYVVIDDLKSFIMDSAGNPIPRMEEEGAVDSTFLGYGRDFKACLKDFYKVSGKAPLLPRWALGNWWSRFWGYNDQELLDLMTKFDEEGVPLSVCMVDMEWHTTNIPAKYGSGWTGYSWNRDLFPDPEAFLQTLKGKGLHIGLNLHPALGIRPHEDCYEDVVDCMRKDHVYDQNYHMTEVDPHTIIPFDLADAVFRKAYFEKVHHPHEAMGVDFWWIDWQQGEEASSLPIDPMWQLNHYHFMDLGRDPHRRPITFSRWPGLGGHRYPIGFSGDTVISWDSLNFQPFFTANAANAGFGWWSHDIGGHYNGVDTPELYVRWLQFGVFSPIMRLHSARNPYTIRTPFDYDEPYKGFSTRFLRLRHEMLPYIYTMNWQHAQGEMPLIRPLYYDSPYEGSAFQSPNTYYFGSELLVCPITEPMDQELGMSRVKLWLPEGDWFDYFDGTYYEGGREHLLLKDLGEMPVFVRAGGIIPQDKDISIGCKLPSQLAFRIYPGRAGEFELIEDDGESQDYRSGVVAKTKVSVQYVNNHMIIDVKIEDPHGLIPDDRVIKMELRSFKDLLIKLDETEGKHLQDGIHKQKEMTLTKDPIEGKSQSIIVPKMSGQIALRLAHEVIPEVMSIDEIPMFFANKAFDHVEAIMKVTRKASIANSYKETMGYVKRQYRSEATGLLADYKTPFKLAGAILAADLPDRYAIATAAMALKGAEHGTENL